MWSIEPIVAAAMSALEDAADRAVLEQAVRGIDSLTELGVQAIVAAGLAAVGFGVYREARYPSDRHHARRSQGRRCDLVLTPPGLHLESETEQIEVFVGGPVCPIAQALWIEVKVVAQFVECRANRGYSAAIQGLVWSDLEKLASETKLEHVAQLIVLFTVDASVADHDVDISLARAMGRGLLLDRPRSRGFEIPDRSGNRRCTTVLVPVRR
jgi:hypothetical protein